MNSSVQSIIVMVVLLVVMYFMLIRPQNKKDKAEKEMRSNLQVGDEIMTVGGIYGKVVRIREDRLTIASGAEKTKLEISKNAVSHKITEDTKQGKVVADEKSGVNTKKIKKLGKKEDAAPEAETPAAPVAEEPAAETIEAPAEEAAKTEE